MRKSVKNVLLCFAFSKSLCVLCLACMLTHGLAQKPGITSFTPQTGSPGMEILISGHDFSTAAQENLVSFGSVRASVISASASSLRVKVPSGASTGLITVTRNYLSAQSSRPFQLTFTGGGAVTNNSFSGIKTLDDVTDGQAWGLTLADLNMDGLAEVILTDRVLNVISVYRNISKQGVIDFDKRLDFPTGTMPMAVQAGDVNGDGRPDLVVTNQNDNSVSVFINNFGGQGIALKQKADFTVGALPQALALADLDDDGRMDIVATCGELAGKLSVLLNTGSNGNVSFGSYGSIASGSGPVQNLSLADFDNDGKPDLAVTNGSFNSISTFRNGSTPGNISFTGKKSYPVASFPTGITANDFDGDGYIDVAAINSSSVNVFRNISGNGDVNFAGSQQLAGSFNFSDLSSADLNGDGKPDIAVLNAVNDVWIFENKSTPGQLSMGSPVKFGTIASRNIRIVDLNADGRPDFAVSGSAYRCIVYRNRYTEPAAKGFSPDTATTGTTVTITGTNFSNVSGVSFGGVQAKSFTVISNTKITAVVGNGASGDIVIRSPQGTDVLEGFFYVPGVAIASFTPLSGNTGDVVGISGDHFEQVTGVFFGGIPARSFDIRSNTFIQATVGNGASGDVTLVSRYGGAFTAPGFKFNGPEISSFLPEAGGKGDTIKITGTRFTQVDSVFFGPGKAAYFKVLDESHLYAVVADSGSGTVTVFTTHGTGSKPGFDHRGPSISSFSPVKIGQGSVVTINGSNLQNVTAVVIGGVPAASFQIVSAHLIRAVAGKGKRGQVTVLSPAGTGSRDGVIFSDAPVISEISPLTARTGATLTITGGNFSSNAAANMVYVGSSKANVLSASGGVLTVKVPPGVAYGPVTVTSGGLTGYSPKAFQLGFENKSPGSLSFGAKNDTRLAGSAYDIRLGDLDSDGKPDLVAGNFDGRSISFFKNLSTTGTAVFGPKADSSVFPYVRKVTMADFNGDGKPDIITNNGIFIFRNISTGGNIAFTSPQQVPVSGSWQVSAAGDLDLDGKPDLVLADLNKSLAVLMNTGSGQEISFGQPIYIKTPLDCNAIDLTDFDGDGFPDIAAVGGAPGSSGILSLYRSVISSNDISFDAVGQYETPNYPFDLVAADFNLDGYPDIAVSCFDSPVTSIFPATRTNGVAGFGKRTDYSIGYARGIAAGDINGDGKLDLAVNLALRDNIAVLVNTGAGRDISFDVPQTFACGDFPQAVVIADVDGDSKPDLLTCNYQGSVSLLTNRSGTVFNVKAGNWDDPSIWSNNQVPGVSDDVLLKYDVIVDKDATCHSLITGIFHVQVKEGVHLEITGK